MDRTGGLHSSIVCRTRKREPKRNMNMCISMARSIDLCPILPDIGVRPFYPSYRDVNSLATLRWSS